MKIDVHVHLAGIGTQGSGCWISPRFQRRVVFRYLRWKFGISRERLAESIDQDWLEWIAAGVRGSEIDRAVVLGFDGAYDAVGCLDENRSQMIIPPSWVFEACRRHPHTLLPAPSINPLRADALERLEESIERGAVLLKWLPSAQGIDPASPKLDAFYTRAAQARLPILIHAGGSEQTFEEIAPELNDISRLRRPLEAGVPVICAHSGAPVIYSRQPDQTETLRELLLEFPHLWLDNSGMANPSRFPSLARFARDPLFRERTLHGTDYPIPAHSFYYVRRLGPRAVLRIEAENNPFTKDIRIKRALGYPDDTLTRAGAVLANLHHWATPPT